MDLNPPMENLNFLMKNFVRFIVFEDQRSQSPEAVLNDFKKEFTDCQIEVCLVGSCCEQLDFPKPLGKTKSSKDVPVSDVNVLVLDKSKQVNTAAESSERTFFAQIYTGDSHSGYAKLKLIPAKPQAGSSFYSSRNFKIVTPNELYHKDPTSDTTSFVLGNSIPAEPAVETALNEALKKIGDDFLSEPHLIEAIPCPSWPVEATEWITRLRKHNWPSRQDMDAILKQGFHLVPVPHHHASDEEHEWRISFPKAEKQLALSLETHQRTCYLLMKLLCYTYINDLGILTSYHLKTCFFWMCEQHNDWSEKNMGTQLLLLLDTIIQCVKIHNIPNYFIKENNMIDHFTTEELKSTLNRLQILRSDILGSLMPFLEIYNGSFSANYDAIQTVLHFTGVKMFTVQNFYTQSSSIFQQIMEPIMCDTNHNQVDMKHHVMASLGFGLSLLTTGRLQAAMDAFYDFTGGMQSLLTKEWNDKHCSMLVMSILVNTAFGFSKNEHSLLQHINELLDMHLRCKPHSDHSLIAYTQVACSFLLDSSVQNAGICDTVMNCLGTLSLTNIVMSHFLRATYSKAIKNEDAFQSSLKDILQLDPAALNSSMNLKRSTWKSIKKSLNQFDPGFIANDVVTMANEILEKEEMNILHLSIGMHNDVLIYECEYADGTLQITIGLLACLLLVNSTEGWEAVVRQAIADLSEPVTPSQWFLTGFIWYTLNNFEKAKKAFKETLKQKPGHIGACIFGILCDTKQGLVPPPPKRNNLVEQENTTEIMDTRYAFNIYSLLNDEELALLFSVFQNREFNHGKHNFLRVVFARRLQIASFLHKDQNMELNYAEMSAKLLQLQSTPPDSNPNSALHYINFLHTNSKQLVGFGLYELENQIENFPCESIDLREFSLYFDHSEKLLLPDFISETLDQVDVIVVAAELFLLYIKAKLRQVKTLFQKADSSFLDSLPEILAPFDNTNSVSFASRLSESVNLTLAGSILYLHCQYDNARSMFINALNRFPGTSHVVYQKIKNCEDKLMNQTVAYMLQENFTEAYSTYSSLWSKCLPRCSPSCSGILHLSEELLDMAQEDSRALHLSTEYLYYADTQCEKDCESSILHRPHVIAVLAYLEYRLSLNATEEVEKERLLDASKQHLLDSATSTNSGSLYTHLGNLLLMQEKHSEALPYLEKALELGIGLNTQEELPHELLSLTTKFRMDNFLPVDAIFQSLVCFSDGHYRSFVVYAAYLMITCKLTTGDDPTCALTVLQNYCQKTNICHGEQSVLGLCYLNMSKYEMAAFHFEKALQNGMFQKKKMVSEFLVLSKCCSMLEDVSDPGVLKELISGWISMLKLAKKEAIVIDSLNTVMYETVESVSLGLYMASQLPQCLDIVDPGILDKLTKVYAFLQTQLSGFDHLVDGMYTNLAILLGEKFMSLKSGQERDTVGQQATEAFKRALDSPDISLTTTRLAYAEFLLNKGMISEAIEQSEMAAEMAREVVGAMLVRSIEYDEDLSENDMQMMIFYLQKSLVPASDYLLIGHSILCQFEKAFDVVDTLVAFLLRAQNLKVDPLVYLIKCTVELLRFGAPMNTLILLYDAVVERYPASRFIPTIHNNMGCLLFTHARTLNDPTEQAMYIQKAKASFKEAILYEDATMALYADYINLLYNTEEYESALTCICESDSLPDSAKGSNSYGQEDMNCVDQCIQELIQSSDSKRFITDSHFYVQYLRVVVLIALQKEVTFIKSEIKVLLEDGEDKEMDCVNVMCKYLTGQLDR